MLISLAACSAPPMPDAGVADDDAGVDAGGVVVTAASYCEATVDFFCDYYLRCGRIVAADPAECRSTFLESCNERYEQRYVDLEDAGLLTLSAVGVEACRAHLATVACERQLSDLAGPCAAMWEGRQPAGAACGLDVQSFTCAPGTACVLGLDLCGTCRPAVDAGAACGADAGVTCGGEATCLEGRCVQRAQAGEACSTSQPCVLGAGCVNGVCRGNTIVGVGEACDASRRCPYRSACQGGRCVKAGLLGDDCSASTCASGRCVAEGAAKVCRPFLEVGAACSVSIDCRSASCVMGTCRSLPDACFSP